MCQFIEVELRRLEDTELNYDLSDTPNEMFKAKSSQLVRTVRRRKRGTQKFPRVHTEPWKAYIGPSL